MFSSIAATIRPRRRDLLGGFEVARALPSVERRSVGPFVFFDHMGPATFAPGKGLDVRAHPHIGLATVTYLFDGEIMHRDSLGTVQPIRPGDCNWMVAGKGIVHSERTRLELRRAGHALHGIQTWLALPKSKEAMAPAFTHYPAQKLPSLNRGDVNVRLIAGKLFGLKSPVKTQSETVYADVMFVDGSSIDLTPDYPELAIYVVEGTLQVSAETITAGTMAVLMPELPVTLNAKGRTRAMILGGAPLDGPRHLWWNYVASDERLIDDAAVDWTTAAKTGFNGGRFTLPPEETEHIPAPKRGK
ncbi:MAG: pirin family protein [Rhodospirillaceae bacterium]|nr:pirin family protein [Rhodospirillaceae bacterium]